MQQDFPPTSQGFIRALKAPADPPSGCALSKIQMASQAWSQSTLYFPNKDQVITDWILNRFLKEKDKPSPENPLLDVDHWKLLSSIVCCADIEGTRLVKAWLIPILNRTPFAPIFIAFLDKVSRLPPELQTTIFTPFALCFSSLWPLAKHKIHIEALLECFSATLNLFSLHVNQIIAKPCGPVCSAVAKTYLSALPRAPSRKKLSSTFLSSHLEIWLRCIPVLQDYEPNDLYSAGAESLFSLEVLRQLVDDPISNPVIQALSQVDPTVVLPSLPVLLESFHEFTTRNRANLFSHQLQATHAATDKVRESAIGFYNACDDLICTSHIPAPRVWNARLRLLSIVKEKKVFSSAQQHLKPILSDKCRLAVDQLCSQETEETEVILGVICCFSRIDFDFVSPYVSSVLPVVAKLPPSSKAAAEFLELGLDYHKKTRTLPTYFSTIIDALGKTTDNMNSSNPYGTYATILGGPVFEGSHAEELRQALRSFVTPGQCLGFLAHTKGTLTQVCSDPSGEQYTPGEDNTEQSHKRRKLDPPTFSPAKAVKFAFVCRMVAIIWTSLPFHLLVDESRLEAVNEIQDVNPSVIGPLLAVGLKRKRDEQGSTSQSWSRDVIVSSALRLEYVLSSCTSLNYHPARDPKTESRMLRLLELSDVLPELKIEITQSLLMSASFGTFKNVQTLVERLTSCMETANTFQGESWGGKAFQLSRPDKGPRQLGSALLSILSHRWLPALSDAATAEDLKRFVRLLFPLPSEGCSAGDCHTQGTDSFLVAMSLRSPAFWELPELRVPVLSYLRGKTSHLDIADITQTLENPPPSSEISLEICGIQAVYTVLRYAPMEYLPKSVRVELTKKAVLFDGQLISVQKPGLLSNNLMDVLSLSREYIGRSLAHAAVFNRLETNAVTKYFLSPRWGTPIDSPAFPTSVTERLINAHLNIVLKSYQPDDELGVLVVIESVHPTLASTQDNFRQRLLTITLGAVMRSFPVSRFSPRVRQDLRSLLSSALRATEEQVLRLASTLTLGGRDITLLSTNLELWCTLISFRAWMSEAGISVPMLATAVTKTLSSWSTEPASPWSKIRGTVILVSLSELSTVSVSESSRESETFLAIYLSLSHANEVAGQKVLASNFMPYQPLPGYVFETVLIKILEFCSEAGTNLADMIAMVRLSQMLLRNPPEGTMKVTQRHTTGFLHLFLNRQGIWCTDTSASLEICRLIYSVCTERPATLRPGDVMLTWTILFKLLSGSEHHGSSTSTDIFREIVGITGALVRHRRDLVLPGLPHLGMVLQRLVAMVRAARPGLGVKQTKAIANSFPFWFNVREPLGIPEFKALSRVLVSLTTKTTVRGVGSVQENQKMESLARPFGKHAPYVLVTYTQAVNDPLCVVYAATRKELYPGLFALCDLLSDHDREAMVLSALDGGGKAAMKTLWNDYKKQKYVGQG